MSADNIESQIETKVKKVKSIQTISSVGLSHFPKHNKNQFLISEMSATHVCLCQQTKYFVELGFDFHFRSIES